MTVSSGAWYRTGKVTLVNGSKSIVGTDTFWLSSLIAVAVGDIFSVDSATWYEVTSVSADGSLKLDRNFEGGSAGPINYAIIRNTSGTVLTRIAGQIAVQFNQKQLFLDELRTWLNSVNTTENVTDSHGVSTAITTPAQMESEHSGRIAQVDTLVNGISAMTKSEFFALAEKRKADSAGSGFSEWGKQWESSTVGNVNQGLWGDEFNPITNSFYWGRGSSESAFGTSRSNSPIININGVTLGVINIGAYTNERNKLTFPNAPDGTETYDTSNGNVVQHASAELAFASETATNKVITSRQDFVFLESWHEKISDRDLVVPLGNVQYGGTTYQGITTYITTFLNVTQGYSAFGEWDTETKGRGLTWSTLSDADKETFIQDHENNIYSEGGELIQVRYRVRVVKGLGDDWANVSINNTDGTNLSGYIGYSGSKYISIRGSLEAKPDFIDGLGGSSDRVIYANSFMVSNKVHVGGVGLYSPTKYGSTDSVSNIPAHNGLCFAIPIALVSRRNSGAYHSVYNSEGTNTYDGAVGNLWFNTSSNITSKYDCFNPVNVGTHGAIASGFSGRSDLKFYDAIYASDVSDLRMSSKKLPLSEIREKYKRMAIAGEVRGFEGVAYIPAILINSSNFSVSNGSTYLIGGGINGFSITEYFLNGQFREGIILRLFTSSIAQGGKGEYGYLSDGTDTYRLQPWGNEFHTAVAKYNGSIFVIGDYTAEMTNGRKLLFIPPPSVAITSLHRQANPTWTDIIGSPSNIAATFPDGVEGQWIPVIPDGIVHNYPLNRKMITGNQIDRENTDDNGISWEAGSSTIDTTINALTNATFQSTRVRLQHYETQAHFTSDSDNSKVLDLGGVIGTTGRDVSYGNLLLSSLIGEIGTAGDYAKDASLVRVQYNSTGKLVSDGDTWKNSHTPTYVLGTGPAIKTLDYLSHDNNVAKLCYAYKEMVWDNGAAVSTNFSNQSGSVLNSTLQVGVLYNITSGRYSGYYRCVINNISVALNDEGYWGLDSKGNMTNNSGVIAMELYNGNGFGDNNKFEITNNQSTLTDDNGNSVLYGSASFDTQYFIVET
jgi:hypothetical protein